MCTEVWARRTGRQAQAAMMEEVEEDDEKTIMFQSSMKKTGVNERWEELESDEFSM